MPPPPLYSVFRCARGRAAEGPGTVRLLFLKPYTEMYLHPKSPLARKRGQPRRNAVKPKTG